MSSAKVRPILQGWEMTSVATQSPASLSSNNGNSSPECSMAWLVWASTRGQLNIHPYIDTEIPNLVGLAPPDLGHVRRTGSWVESSGRLAPKPARSAIRGMPARRVWGAPVRSVRRSPLASGGFLEPPEVPGAPKRPDRAAQRIRPSHCGSSGGASPRIRRPSMTRCRVLLRWRLDAHMRLLIHFGDS